VQHWTGELALDAGAELGEGPVWDARHDELLWVDIRVGLVHRFDPRSGSDRTFDVGQSVGAVVPRAGAGYAVAVRDGFAVTDADGQGLRLAAPVEADLAHMRMNDGACDSRGRLWAGTMHLDETTTAGSLYRLDADGSVETMVADVTISNGIAWSPDDSLMYFVDTPLGLDVFDYEPETGAISGRRRLVTIEEGAGHPDGIAVDVEGAIWVALWDGWAVRRYAPDGTLVGVVEIPVGRVTKPAFGGADLDELYVTTASPDAPDPAQPHAGGVFRASPGIRGLAPHPYAG
jgi:sugar lactone lactonase YvrE